MITLLFTTVSQHYKYREFEYDLGSIEQAIQLLNHVYRKGDTLVNAQIWDEHQCFPLPIEVIDGEDLAVPFRQLEIEWQASLQPYRG